MPFVQTTRGGANSGAPISTAFGTTTVIGNTIVVGITTGVASSAHVNTVTDSGSNIYVKAFAFSNSFDTNTEVWYAPVASATAALTVTVSTTTGVAPVDFVAQEWSGIVASNPIDQTISATASSGTAVTATTAATTSANEVVFAVAANDNSATYTVGTGYSNFDQKAVGFGSVAMESKIVATTGTQTATFTQSTSVRWTSIIVTFILATPVVVQSVAFKSVNTTPATGAFASNITAGNAILLLGGNDDNPSVFGAFSDTRGNTYNSLFAAVQPNGGNAFGAWLATNSTGGANTISAVTDTFDNFSFIAYEISGLANSSTLDVANSTFPAYNTVSTTTTTNSITTANANDILIAAYFDNSFTPPTAVTAGTGYANAQFIANVFTTLVAQTKTVSATGTYSANVTETYAAGNANTSGIMIALKAAGGATVTALGATLLMMGI